jgi:hypothetical protein
MQVRTQKYADEKKKLNDKFTLNYAKTNTDTFTNRSNQMHRTHAEQTQTVNHNGGVRANDEKNQGMTDAQHT